MYKNKYGTRNNISGIQISVLRKRMHISQRILSEQLQLAGIDMDKNQIQRIESGERFVTDIELIAFARVFNVSVDEFYK